MIWSLTHFDDILDKMKGVTGTYSGSCVCNQAQHGERYFSAA